MFKRWSKWLVVVLLVLATGGHWALLQTVAWVSMTARYAQDSMLKVALAKTFDGQHPCEICKLVQQGKSTEQKQIILRTDFKLDLFPAQIATLLYPPSGCVPPTSEPDSTRTRAESPPTPPPRVV